MVSVLLNWLYMALITYLTGSLLLLKYKGEKKITLRVLTGVVFVTCCTQVMSLFGKVSLADNLILIGVAAAGLICCKTELLVPLRKLLTEIPGSLLWIPLVIVLIFACSTAGPTRQFDTNYYHAQTIHWLEEYGTVKGVANLFYPLANNSAGHYYDAVFSLSFLTGRSLHTSGGFFGTVIFLHGFALLFESVVHKVVRQNKAGYLSVGIAVSEMIYAVIMTSYYTDPYTDILPNILVFFVMAEWILQLDKEFQDCERYAIYAILALFAAVCKLTVWPIGLLALKPFIMAIKKRRWKLLWTFIAAAILTIVPICATNAMISGYILYPVYFLDLLQVPWKLDPDILKWEVSSAVEFARLRTTDVFHPLNHGVAWIPAWWATLPTIYKALYSWTILLFAADIVVFIRRTVGRKLSQMDYRYAYLRLVCYITIVYWFVTMPEQRFIWSFFLLVLLMVPAALAGCQAGCSAGKVTAEKKGTQTSSFPSLDLEKRGRFQVKTILVMLCATVSCGLMLVYGAFNGYRTIGYAYSGLVHATVMQTDYERREGVMIERGGFIFASEVIGEPYVCGYHLFPYFENASDRRTLMTGDSIRDGFYFSQTTDLVD